MKKILLFIIFPLLLGSVNEALGQLTNKEEASQIASNWIQMVIDKKGHWGDGEWLLTTRAGIQGQGPLNRLLLSCDSFRDISWSPCGKSWLLLKLYSDILP